MRQKAAYDRQAVGERLLERRRQLGWSRRFLAERIGLAEKYYADIERGYCGMSIETLMALTQLMGFSMDALICGEEGTVLEMTPEAVLMKKLGTLPDQEKEYCMRTLLLIMKGMDEEDRETE